MDKGTVVELTITDMTDDGKGIGHIDGLTVFVDGSIPGDTVRGKIIQDKKRYAVAELEEILTPSPNREEAVCPYFGRCGGCSLQSMKYEAQLVMKKNTWKTNSPESADWSIRWFGMLWLRRRTGPALPEQSTLPYTTAGRSGGRLPGRGSRTG